MSKLRELLNEQERVLNAFFVEITSTLNEYLLLIKLHKVIKEQHETGVHFDDDVMNVLNELEQLETNK